ncbi:MAG: MDR family MFS transporter [Acidithiobacillus sp.]
MADTSTYRLSFTQKSMFLAVLSAIFLAAMDQTVVATALPTIAKQLHALAHLPWVITAYLLASTVMLPIYGKMGDLLGRKSVLIFAVGAFLAGSALSGAAWNLDTLVLFRGLQGLGGGGILVSAVASISDFIPLEQRGKYQGLVGAAFGLATLVGPLLGGFVVEQWGWRWIFYLNLPFGLFCLSVIQWAFPKVDHRSVSFDWAGSVSLVVGLTALILFVDLPSGIFRYGIGILFLLTLLVLTQWSAKHPEPIFPLQFFRHRTFTASVIVSFFVGISMLGSISFLPTYFQVVRELTPTESGLQMLFLLAGMLFTSITSGRWISKHQRFRFFPIVGTLLIAISLVLLSRISVDTPIGLIDACLLLLGIGLGSTMQVMVLSAQWALPHRHLGVATSTVSLFRSMGGTLGVAGFGAVFTHFVGHSSHAHPEKIVLALHWDFMVSAVLVFFGFLAAWNLEELSVLKERRKTGASDFS